MVVKEVRPLCGGRVLIRDDACTGISEEEMRRRAGAIGDAILRIYQETEPDWETA